MDHQHSARNIAPLYSQHTHNQHHFPPQQVHTQGGPFYPQQRASIDVDALAAGVQRYLPGRPPPGYVHSNSYIHLPPGVDPATVDFRTFYPYNPSEVKHRKRTTRSQLKVLEDTFKRETKPNAALRKQLAAQLEMTPRGVQVWFQNRRAKEKTLAKKVASSTANGGKSISLGAQKNDGSGDADGDVDRDDGDVVGDDENANCEQAAHPARHNPGTGSALNDLGRSYSSSNSPESTSPELTPPNALIGFQPQVNGSPRVIGDATATPPETKDTAGFPPSSWQEHQRSMNRTPTLGMCVEPEREFSPDSGYGTNGTNVPAQDHFMRRPSLPTHLGIGPSRVRSAYHGSPRLLGSNLGGVNVARISSFDPTTRRMSVDRLASHPYAHLAAQANTAVYGPYVSRFRPSLPATAHSTPTHTPQARTTELPPINATHADNGDGDSNSRHEMHELSLPPHMQQSSSNPEGRPELMHRQSLPAHLSVPDHFASTSYAPPPQSASPMPMRFPRPSQVYALSSRTYQPPIPGPLPNPNFSFGSVGSGEGEGTHTDGSRTPDTQLQASLSNFQFPPVQEGKEDSGASGANNGMDMEMEGDGRSALPSGGIAARRSSGVYYRDTQLDPYASRFGSIASIASIAETESSVTSGGYFSSETGSFDVQQDGISSVSHSSTGYNDARRTSCTGSMMDMFSNLDMHNNSHSSLPHPQEPPTQDGHQSQVPISKSSELALALMPDGDSKSSSVYGGDNGSSVNVNTNDTSDAGIYNRANLSSSDLSHGHGSLHRHPLAMSSRSAGSSRSSLSVPSVHQPRLRRIETDKLDFLHNYDAVSETGHYSPVSHPNSGGFDFGEHLGSRMNNVSPMSGAQGGGVVSIRDGMEQDSGSMSHASTQQYGLDGPSSREHQHQPQSRSPFHPSPGPFNKDGTYIQQHASSSYSLSTHSQENIAPYGYYN